MAVLAFAPARAFAVEQSEAGDDWILRVTPPAIHRATRSTSLTGPAITVAIETVNIRPNNSDTPSDIGGAIPGAAGAIDVTRDRNALFFVTGVTLLGESVGSRQQLQNQDD